MDSECAALLPLVLSVLADPKQSLPDDTSLEKLLDWFRELIGRNDGLSFLQQQTCVLEFISNVCKSETTDPTMLSFTFKLTGLLAVNENNYRVLQERGVLVCVFESWSVSDMWDNATIRSGWLQGLSNMLQHQSAMDFICKTGLTRLILQLQADKSLFVSTLAHQLLARILSFHETREPINDSDVDPGLAVSAENRDWTSVTMEIVNHVFKTLASDSHNQVLQGLRLLTLTIPHCQAPLRGMLWRGALGPLEVLVNAGSSSLTQPIMELLQTAARTSLLSQSENRIEELMEAVLSGGSLRTAVMCAMAIVQLENCSENLKRKATKVILQPLQCLTEWPVSSQDAGDTDEMQYADLVLELKHKASFISLLSLCLSCVADLIQTESAFVDVHLQLVTHSVLALLRICLGENPAPSPCSRAAAHLIGCCKVQRCGLDTLACLSTCESNVSPELRSDAFRVLLQYLQHPDPDATVLKKALQATLRWTCVCSHSPDVWSFIHQDLFPVLKKRVCDVRWEVRDSSLEFITQLTSHFTDNSSYRKVLESSGLVSLVQSSLSDSEAYVRASAVSAMGQLLTSFSQQGEPLNNMASLQEQAVTCLVDILGQDTEGFPRRAVVKVFTTWLTQPLPFPELDQSLSTVLLLGGDDFDWEVKFYTLELAEVLMEKMLSQCPYAADVCASTKKTRLTRGLCKLKELGVFGVLFKGLFDCDRPVSQKACDLLLRLREVMSETQPLGDHSLIFEIQGQLWDKEILQRHLEKQMMRKTEQSNERLKSSRRLEDTDTALDRDSKEPVDDVTESPAETENDECDRSEKANTCTPNRLREMSLADMLRSVDLEEMQRTLSLSSDHMVNSAKSLMEDILSVAQQAEENTVDCY
ncbi:integrator complex assembly factor BRAT1 [Chanos chanos]|uniref:Integrator complex assembly factor BRAT1 n=1 Tax=Chanos chanos TaxID=29144 RepID=A0A6J2VZT1_CHACN|nr:BRCA1-associated ATM activator 1 [Chanos chanos]